MIDLEKLETKLLSFHKPLVKKILKHRSPIAGNQFPGDFNVSGFHNEVLSLPQKPESFWGVDQCLRMQETPDQTHTYVFNMGVYAKSVDLKQEFVEPFKDNRFHALQSEVISQFMKLMKQLGIESKSLETTYCAGTTIGGQKEGRDKLLKRKYYIPADVISARLLKKYKVKAFPVNSIANIDINAIDGALVGPRMEVAINGVEIATIVFNCFRIQSGKLQPINYVAGYALGLERLAMTINRNNILTVNRYYNAQRELARQVPAAKSSLFATEVYQIISAAEALSVLPNKLSSSQKEKVRQLKKKVAPASVNIGLSQKDVQALVDYFKK